MRTPSLALALLAACSFDATFSATPVTVGSGDDDTASTTGTGTEAAPTSTGPVDPSTSTGPATLTTTTPDPTTSPDPSTTEPVDPTTTDSSSESGSGSSGPPPPECGNGQTEDGEACDDGNGVDEDACTNLCTKAVCGDGVTFPAVEACDDGNGNDGDGCSAACIVETCSDGLVNNNETDLDCGGPCDGCAAGLDCVEGDDCEFGNCAGGACQEARDCLQIEGTGAASGPYTIDPDQEGSTAPFMVWCELEVMGGGWTLALKIDGRQPSFAYADAKWGQTEAWNPDPDLGRSETKLLSYSTVAVNEVLIGLETPIQADPMPLTLKYMQFNVTDAASLHAIFEPGVYQATSAGVGMWQMLVASSGLQNNCEREGFNVKGDSADPANYARVRIGILGNNEDSCQSPDSWLGIGGTLEGDSCGANWNVTTGNAVDCDQGPDKNIASFAVVYVR